MPNKNWPPDPLRDKHLADAAPGTPLHAAMERVWHGTPSAQDLIDFARWELWEAIMSLDPWVPREYQDGFHAGCCASRAEGALRRLEKLLVDQKSVAIDPESTAKCSCAECRAVR